MVGSVKDYRYPGGEDPIEHLVHIEVIWTLGRVLNPAIIYSVTQSYTNSFLGYVVLDSFNMVYRDEDSILDKIYQSKYFWPSVLKIKFF